MRHLLGVIRILSILFLHWAGARRGYPVSGLGAPNRCTELGSRILGSSSFEAPPLVECSEGFQVPQCFNKKGFEKAVVKSLYSNQALCELANEQGNRFLKSDSKIREVLIDSRQKKSASDVQKKDLHTFFFCLEKHRESWAFQAGEEALAQRLAAFRIPGSLKQTLKLQVHATGSLYLSSSNSRIGEGASKKATSLLHYPRFQRYAEVSLKLDLNSMEAEEIPLYLVELTQEVSLLKKISKLPDQRGLVAGFEQGEGRPEQALYTEQYDLPGDKWLSRSPRPSFCQKLQALAQLAQGLANLHKAHLIHRDLKPGNFFISPATATSPVRAAIGDFGSTQDFAPDNQTAYSNVTSQQFLNKTLSNIEGSTPEYLDPQVWKHRLKNATPPLGCENLQEKPVPTQCQESVEALLQQRDRFAFAVSALEWFPQLIQNKKKIPDEVGNTSTQLQRSGSKLSLQTLDAASTNLWETVQSPPSGLNQRGSTKLHSLLLELLQPSLNPQKENPATPSLDTQAWATQLQTLQQQACPP